MIGTGNRTEIRQREERGQHLSPVSLFHSSRFESSVLTVPVTEDFLSRQLPKHTNTILARAPVYTPVGFRRFPNLLGLRNYQGSHLKYTFLRLFLGDSNSSVKR